MFRAIKRMLGAIGGVFSRKLETEGIASALHKQEAVNFAAKHGIPQTMQIGYGHHQAGRLSEAARAYEQVLQDEPDHPEALHLLGVVSQQLGKSEASLQLLDKAILGSPSNPFFLSSRGNTLQELRRYDEALASYERALAIKPDFAEAWINRGTALRELKRYDEGLASYDKALTLRAGDAELLHAHGNVLRHLRRYDEAIASYDRALAINPDFVEALDSRGNALMDLKLHEEALANFARAQQIRPDFAQAYYSESKCLLLLGDFERGWEKHEWRWNCDQFLSSRRNFSQPLWLGIENIAGKTILLHAEQGLGDTIQFARYVQAVSQKGASVILEAWGYVRPLLSHVSGAHQVIGRGDPLPEFDVHCPLMSLPLAFNTRLDTIPAPIPYLRATDAKMKKWEEKLGRIKTLTVGIAWSGRSEHHNDRNRSLPLSKLIDLKKLKVRLVSLQKEVRPEDAKVLAANGEILHLGPELEDFSDTAALASLMDLVISVDTSIAHLVGALGKPVWILLPFAPDWRWLLDREDSPWYPTARLFRQSRAGDWDSVIDRVKRDLITTAS